MGLSRKYDNVGIYMIKIFLEASYCRTTRDFFGRLNNNLGKTMSDT